MSGAGCSATLGFPGMGGDLLVTGGRIYRGAGRTLGARGLAIEDGLIVKVGSELEARRAAPRGAVKLRVPGGWVYPGFNDAHIHLTRLDGEGLDLSRLVSVVDILEAVRAVYGRGEGPWILGRGWDQEGLREGRPPTRQELDVVSPDRPVLLYRVCGHVAVANSKALEHLEPSMVSQGLVDWERGIVGEMALKRLTQLIPPPPRGELLARLERNGRRAAAAGLTMVQVMLSQSWREELEAFRELAEASKLVVRAALWFPAEHAPVARGLIRGEGGLLTFGGAKLFLDGSLGARTAALFQAYSDAPDVTGIQYYTDEELLELLGGLEREGIRPAMHAIGDRAVEQALRVLSALGPGLERPRIEHASLTTPAHIRRMVELGVCPVIQPHFAVSDRWADRRLGVRLQHLYRFKEMVAAGLHPAGSSDAPVEPYSPLTGIWAAVNNPLSTPLTPEEALELYTGGSAWAAMLEGMLGELREGMLGDLVILSDNLLAVEPPRIRDVGVLATVVGGRLVYRAEWLSS